jgi:hypothetical protein
MERRRVEALLPFGHPAGVALEEGERNGIFSLSDKGFWKLPKVHPVRDAGAVLEA